jgi:hypothetical protein
MKGRLPEKWDPDSTSGQSGLQYGVRPCGGRPVWANNDCGTLGHTADGRSPVGLKNTWL